MDYAHFLLMMEQYKGPTLEELVREVASYLAAVSLTDDVDPTDSMLEVAENYVNALAYEDLIEDDTIQTVQAVVFTLERLGYITLNEEF